MPETTETDTKTFTDAELAGLSEEERAAITAAEDAPVEDPGAPAGDDPNFGASVPDAPATTTAPAEGGGDPAPAVDAGGEPETPVVEAPDAPANPADVVPDMRLAGPEDYEGRMKALDERSDVVLKKFEDGEISSQDMMKETRAIERERTELIVHQANAIASVAMTEKAAKNRWDVEQEIFFEAHKEYNEDHILRSALNAAVVSIARAPENGNRTGTWVLEQAHKEIQKRFASQTQSPKTEAAPAGTPPAATDAVRKTEAGRRPDLKAVPKTLSNLPPAGDAETGSSEFANLDGLEGLDFENALAKLSPDQQARYLKSA